MGFMDAYKRLEKLCRDSLNDDRGVSAYIDEMLNIPRGASAVDTWNTDLKQLKHYRWLRNQIAHNPDCTEENMCSPADEKWLKDFHKRLLDRKDPLALCRKKPPAAKGNRRKKGTGAWLILLALIVLILLALGYALWESGYFTGK